MSITRPTLPELAARAQTDLEARLLDGQTAMRRSTVAVLARVWAGLLDMLYEYLSWLAQQPFVDSAEAEYLERLGRTWGITRKDSTASSGLVTFTGTDGVVIPAGTELQRVDGALYATDAEATVASGTASAAVTASTAGAAGDTDAGVSLTLTSPVASLSSTATVATGGLSGGADAEADAALRTRLLARIQAPPQGGCESDYEAWALAVPGVTRAWVYPRHLGAASVGVAIVCDEAESPIPDSELVAAAQAYIDDRRPVTAEVTVFAPEALAVPVTLAISPDTASVRAAVLAELRDLFAREAEPGGVIYLSHIREAVSVATGETDSVISAPAANVTPDTYEFPVLGIVTFS